jgi:hypothetical protein
MFKNLEHGAQSSVTGFSGDTKIRVDVSLKFFSFFTCLIEKTMSLLKPIIPYPQGFRWHVKMCQPINGSIMKRKYQTVVGFIFSNGVIFLLLGINKILTQMGWLETNTFSYLIFSVSIFLTRLLL